MNHYDSLGRWPLGGYVVSLTTITLFVNRVFVTWVAPADALSGTSLTYLFTTEVGNGNLQTWGPGVGMRRRNDDIHSRTCQARSASGGRVLRQLARFRSARMPPPTQDSLPAAGQALPDGFSTRKVATKGFRSASLHLIPLSQALLGTMKSTDAHKPFAVRDLGREPTRASELRFEQAGRDLSKL